MSAVLLVTLLGMGIAESVLADRPVVGAAVAAVDVVVAVDVVAVDDATVAPADRAAAAFAAGRYEEAKAAYEKVLSGLLFDPGGDPDIDRWVRRDGDTVEPPSVGPVLFNLGCCAARLDKPAEAVWYFRRAALRRPHDPELARNLALARQAADPTAAAPDVLVRITDWFDRRPPWLVLLAIAAGQLAGLLGLVLLGRSGTRRAVCAFLIGLSLAAGWRFARRGGYLPTTPTGVVLVRDTPVRGEPHLEEPVLSRLPAGVTIEVLEGSDQWLRVEYAGATGWCSRSAIGRVE